jgi:hypothetical protein
MEDVLEVYQRPYDPDDRRGVDLIQNWRTEEVRHGSSNPVEAGLRCDAAALNCP